MAAASGGQVDQMNGFAHLLRAENACICQHSSILQSSMGRGILQNGPQ